MDIEAIGEIAAGDLTAGAVSQILSDDGDWLIRQPDPRQIIDSLEIDGEIQALDVSIYLHRGRHYRLADRLIARIRTRYPQGHLTFFHSALNCAGMREYERAIRFASQAMTLAPSRLDHRSLLVRICAVAGRIGLARDALQATLANTVADADDLSELAQFVDFCEAYPVSGARSALDRLKDAGAYSEGVGVASTILDAVANRQPFSMIRLGDGEGAWLRLDGYDEGRFATLYRANRVSFLNDWFGPNQSFITDAGFLSFAQNLQSLVLSHDLIGIAPAERLDLEEENLSCRGIPSSVNAFRFLGVYDGIPRGLRVCSNSVNLTLAGETSFYQDLFRAARRIGIITSQRGLADRIAARGIEVPVSYLVPGDSRNFHLRPDGSPERQYPDHVHRIDAELAAMDLRGVVVLVAAGFVGKQYLRTIRNRGGIAIDIGSLADHWARHGLPD